MKNLNAILRREEKKIAAKKAATTERMQQRKVLADLEKSKIGKSPKNPFVPFTQDWWDFIQFLNIKIMHSVQVDAVEENGSLLITNFTTTTTQIMCGGEMTIKTDGVITHHAEFLEREGHQEGCDHLNEVFIVFLEEGQEVNLTWSAHCVCAGLTIKKINGTYYCTKSWEE